MSHTLHWPGKYFFYAIGNTSAICLTRDLAPEQDAKVLLLGCGDPRSILFSIFCEPDNAQRRLDFTCCDFDPAVLARNVILLSMFEDGEVTLDVIWNMFFHAYLDERTLEKLVEHCKKLIDASKTLSVWSASRYGSFIRMCTEQTLADFRRHWQLYVNMSNLPAARLKSIKNTFAQQFKSQQKGSAVSSARSAGPVNMMALEVASQHFSRWWRSGVTFGDSQSITAAKNVNPTFAYSLAGEGFNVHYGTDPLVPFHSAPLYGNSKSQVTLTQAVTAAKEEFTQWRKAFQRSLSNSPSPPVIRFFSGEATALCKAFHSFAATGTLSMGIPVAQWRTHPLVLDKTEYGTHHAPVSFNVIDTSNLDDHIGLLNVLIAAAPLLSSSEPSCLYTESLLYEGTDATKEFSTRLHADMTTVGLLIGLHPVDFLSGFTSHSHFHELAMLAAISHGQRAKSPAGQYHQVITWKRVTDLVCKNADAILPHFDPYQLGSFLYDMYHNLFENEDSMTWSAKFIGEKERFLKALAQSNIIHYIRETFVLFLKLIREHLQFTPRVWAEVMSRFYGLVNMDMTMPMDTMHRQELSAQLYRHNVFTVPWLLDPVPKLGRFAGWKVVPPLVRIILLVPKEKLSVFEESDGTPLLHCDVLGIRCQNIFSSVHVAYGTVTSTGSKADPRVLFNEDPQGKDGSSPLVVSFVVASCILTDLEPQTNLTVNFGVRSTMGTFQLTKKLGIKLHVHSAPFLDESSVFLVPESQIPSKTISPPRSTTIGMAQIGTLDDVLVQLDEEYEMVSTMSRKLLVENEVAKRQFGQEQVNPVITQIGPCTLRVAIGDLVHDVAYPYPVIGSKNKVRLARKSLYVEVVVPISGTFKADGMKLQNFPVIRTNGVTLPWNIHRVNLSCLPPLNTRVPKSILEKWLNPHIGSQMSSRERSLRKTHEDDGVMLVKDTLHSLFARSTGVQGGAAKRVFALVNQANNNCDTVIFVHGLKYDLSSHTLICDGYVLPLTVSLLDRIKTPFERLLGGGITNISCYKSEMKAWKHLLPAFVERCRSWSHTANCEYASQNKVPLTEEMEHDPLCSCGRGKDVQDISQERLWAPFAPHVTRIGFSPLFAVSYLETVGRDLEKRRCRVCRKRGVKACSGCQKVRYCSTKCQKEDWKTHKPVCKP